MQTTLLFHSEANKNVLAIELTRSEKSRYSLFSGAGLVTVRTALYARLALSFRSSVSPSTFHGSLDDADARLFWEKKC